MAAYWDATKIDALKRCPAYYEYVINGRYAPKGGNVHLAFGGAFAEALATYHQADDPEEGLRQAVRGLLATELPHDPIKNRETLVRSFVWYVDEYATDEVYRLPDGSAGVELSFEIDISDDVIFCGHLDKVIRIDGDLYIADQKTSKTALSSWFFRQFEMSDQMAMYSFAAKHLLGSPIRGVIIDGVQITLGYTVFQRSTVHYPLEKLEEWLEDTLWHIEQHDGVPRRRWTSCGLYGGCRMRSVCTQVPSLREHYLNGDFLKTGPWRPEIKRTEIKR